MSESLTCTVALGPRTTLAVEVWGEAGPPVVALHPGVGDRRIWRWCAPVWAARGCRVVAYDRRGFGDTTYTAEPHDDLHDLLAVTAVTGARPAVVVGNSRGAGLAVDLALDHPEQVSGLVLIAPSVTGYDDSDWPTSPGEEDLDRRIERAEEDGDREEVNRLEVHYWLDGPDQMEGRVDGEARDLMTDMNGRALAAPETGPVRERPAAWPRLGELAVPTLVVVGQHDLPGIQRQCAELAAAAPRGRLVTVHDTAHCPMLDDPETLNLLVLDFVQSLLPA